MTEQVLKNNKKNVKLVLKNYPLRNHKFAEPAARAALAAREQGKYWEFHDLLFKSKKLSTANIENIAIGLGLDMAKFRTDMASPEVKAQINRDMQQAQAGGVSGTPSIFINGRKLQDRSVKGFQKIIDEELAKAGKKK